MKKITQLKKLSKNLFTNFVLKEKFKSQLKEYLENYENLYDLRLDLSLDILKGNIQGNDTLEIVKLHLKKEQSLGANFDEYMGSLKQIIKKLSLDSGTLKSFQKIILRFKKEVNLINEIDDGVLFSFKNVEKRFKTNINDFYLFTEEAIKKNQVKDLFLVRRNFVEYHSKNIFTFSKNTVFHHFSVDLFLKKLGMDQYLAFNMFKKLCIISQDHKFLNSDSKTNFQKSNIIPAKKTEKKLKCLNR